MHYMFYIPILIKLLYKMKKKKKRILKFLLTYIKKTKIC